MKQRSVTALTAVAILGVTAGSAAAAPRGATAPAPHCRTLAGSTVTLTTDVGLVEKLTYSADDTRLTAEVVAPGPFPIPVGTTAEESVSTAEVGPATYMVSWVEPTGLTVSQVDNLRTGAAQLFWTYPMDDGSRAAEQHTGTLVCDSRR